MSIYWKHTLETHEQIYLKWKLTNEIKDLVRMSHSSCKEVFDEVCGKAEYQNVARQLLFGNLKSTSHRIRKAECPSNPASPIDVQTLFELPGTMEGFGKTLTLYPELTRNII